MRSATSLTLLCSLTLLLIACREQRSVTQNRSAADGIEMTQPLLPTAEHRSFRLPPGFEVQLVASEPDIGKPINIAFDARGRLWVSQSNAYPFPDSSGAPMDRISILEDTTGDGRADKVTVFADSLNIPIGLLPVSDGVIAYSIPHLYHLIDHDGDDRVDERRILIRDFDYKDTHGMVNNLRWGLDGWIYACHGFANESVVAGKDGDSIRMNSGHTFRFQPDGSRAEVVTSGRVNPFGVDFDDWGYTYSVDCHSSPIYQLIPGGDYPHFGKKAQGLGFAPALMQHEYGSTALAGLVWYQQTHFPEAYRESFYLGDVVKNQLFRYPAQYEGSTVQVNKPEDFLVSEDPWFRPVDLRTGPDGALYIADFYNRIIGHYEVPLDHPGRDRERGRIWRVVFKGTANTSSPDWTQADLPMLWDGLDSPNADQRLQVINQFLQRYPHELPDWGREKWTTGTGSSRQRAHLLWVLWRAKALPDNLWREALAAGDPLVRVHALRLLGAEENWPERAPALAIQSLQSENPHVLRAAAHSLAKRPQATAALRLIDLLLVPDRWDDHLQYVFRQSLRDHLRATPLRRRLLNQSFPPEKQAILADALQGVNHPEAAEYLFAFLTENPADDALPPSPTVLIHTARFLPESQLSAFTTWAIGTSAANPTDGLAAYRAIQKGLQQRGADVTILTSWAQNLAGAILEKYRPESAVWQIAPVGDLPFRWHDWHLFSQNHPENKTPLTLLHSGDTQPYTSRLRSPAFPLPEVFSGWIYGRGEGETPSPTLAFRLRRQSNDQILKSTSPPPGDTAVLLPFSWSLTELVGEPVYLEWLDSAQKRNHPLAAGGWDPAVLSLPKEDLTHQTDQLIFAAQTIRRHGFSDWTPALAEIMQSDRMDVRSRQAAAEALLALAPERSLDMIQDLVADTEVPVQLKDLLLNSAAGMEAPVVWQWVLAQLSDLPYIRQKKLIAKLVDQAPAVDILIRMAVEMRIPPRLLIDPEIADKIADQASAETAAQYARLRSVTVPAREGIQDSIDKRVASYQTGDWSPASGEPIYQLYCASCHQIDGQGGLIGPQLDGVAGWGVRSLTEKILDPNRSISQAFVTYTIRTRDGKTQVGLFRREEGSLRVFADAGGQEFSLSKADILSQTPNPYTLMPAHFAETIPPDDFQALLAFLMQKKQVQ
jgi:putative heme-binding domain-containing protein